MSETGVLPERDFYEFTKVLQIDSKEAGMRSLGSCLLGSQFILMREIRKGLDEGVHEFITLKSRQLGISTMSLAIDLYEVFSNPAINAALVTHDESSRDQFRTTLALYRAGLPDDYQREVIDDNRNQLVFQNGSRLRFLVAGTRARSTGSSRLGRSGALVNMHATETAFWGDPSGIDALRASFAHANPLRLYHWESTANGENWFFDMWNDAKAAKSVRPIFISWWANDYYGLAGEQNQTLFNHYWGKAGKLTKEEAQVTIDVERRYGQQINEYQWAWYRYMAAEKITDSLQMQQEFPHREEDAFISTGSAFFRVNTLHDQRRKAKAIKGIATYHRVEVGTSFAATRVDAAREVVANLTIWRQPEERGWYVLGVDPAYASSPESDCTAISVWRCWYNRLEQVAEFADRSISTHAAAWIFCYLAGYYGHSTVNLELTGPGTAVLQEFQNMRRQAYSGWTGDQAPAMRQVVGSIKQYLFRRPDSTSGSTSFLHTKTNEDVKERMMNNMRDYIERGVMLCASEKLVTEMGSVRREGGSAPGAPSGKGDDRVVAAALAVMCWNDQLRTQLLSQGIIHIDVEKEEKQDNPVNRIVSKYLTEIGLRPDGLPPPKKTALTGQRRWSGKLRDRLTRAENSRT